MVGLTALTEDSSRSRLAILGLTFDPAGLLCFLGLAGLGLFERLPEERLGLRVRLGLRDRLVNDDLKLVLVGLDVRESERLDIELSSDIFLTPSN